MILLMYIPLELLTCLLITEHIGDLLVTLGNRHVLRCSGMITCFLYLFWITLFRFIWSHTLVQRLVCVWWSYYTVLLVIAVRGKARSECRKKMLSFQVLQIRFSQHWHVVSHEILPGPMVHIVKCSVIMKDGER